MEGEAIERQGEMMLKGEGGRDTAESIGGVGGVMNVYKKRSQPTLDFILI